MRICELRQKEVINICNCRRLGFVSDIEFDVKDGHIIAIIVPGCGRIWGIFGRDTEYVIPFPKICQIGPDLILVDLKEEEVLSDCGRGRSDCDRGRSDHDRGCSDRDRGHSDRDRGHSDHDRGRSDRDRGCSGCDRGCSDCRRGHSDGGRGHGA